MKKKILKNFGVIALAVFGFVIIGNNAIYGIDGPIKEGPEYNPPEPNNRRAYSEPGYICCKEGSDYCSWTVTTCP